MCRLHLAQAKAHNHVAQRPVLMMNACTKYRRAETVWALNRTCTLPAGNQPHASTPLTQSIVTREHQVSVSNTHKKECSHESL
jgi:hypothetical protein